MKDDTRKLFQNVPETLRNFLLNDGFSRQHCTAFWRHPESLHKQATEHLLAPCLLLSFAAMQMSTIHTDAIGGIGFNLRGDVAYAVVLNELKTISAELLCLLWTKTSERMKMRLSEAYEAWKVREFQRWL